MYSATLKPEIMRTMLPEGFPPIHAADCCQKNLDHLPLLRGCVFVHTDSRGTGHSPTEQWDLLGQAMQNDLYDLIEWIGVQEWCDGRVGMLGKELSRPYRPHYLHDRDHPSHMIPPVIPGWS